MTGEPIRPQPKPVKREKTRKPLRAKHWGVRRKAGGTAHSRRWRNWGRMAWLHSRRFCSIRAFALGQWRDRIDAHVPDCDGEFQVAHLFGRRRDPHDAKTTLGCREHHTDVDQSRRWFRSLTKLDRIQFKTELAARATVAWETVPASEQARWQEIGEARLGRKAAL